MSIEKQQAWRLMFDDNIDLVRKIHKFISAMGNK